MNTQEKFLKLIIENNGDICSGKMKVQANEAGLSFLKGFFPSESIENGVYLKGLGCPLQVVDSQEEIAFVRR